MPVGTYDLRVNQADGGADIASCGDMTDAAVRQRGVCSGDGASTPLARRGGGFPAMQLNFVVSTNERSRPALAFPRFRYRGPPAARLPQADRGELVDALVMFSTL